MYSVAVDIHNIYKHKYYLYNMPITIKSNFMIRHNSHLGIIIFVFVQILYLL